MSFEDVERALAAMLSGDKRVMDEAERFVYHNLDNNRNDFVLALVRLLRSSQVVRVRHMCAVLLRKKLPAGEPILYDKLPEEIQDTVKSELLEAVVSEPTHYLRRQICDTVSEVAQITLYRGEWPALLPALQQFSASDKPELRSMAFLVFGKLAEDSPDQLEPHMDGVTRIYEAGLQDPLLAVRIMAAMTTMIHVLHLEMAAHVSKFQVYIPAVMETLTQCLGEEEYVDASKLIRAVVEVATHAALFFKPLVNEVSDLMFRIGSSDDMNPQLRRLAMEWFTAAAVDRPNMCRRSETFVSNAFNLAIVLMLTVEDEPNWEVQEEASDADRSLRDDTLYDRGELAIDRLAQSIRYKKTMPIVFPIVKEFVNNTQDWRYRYVGLMALGQVAEIMKLEEIPVPELVNFVQDPHPRVCYAAVHCIGQLSTDFSPEFEFQYHAMVLPMLMQPLSDKRFPRLQKHAAAALFNFIDGCETADPEESEAVIHPYVDGMVRTLFEQVESGHSRTVQEQCMTALASISGAAPTTFLEYYPTVVPAIKNVIAFATGPEDRYFRARAMEAVTFIGSKMGPEVFRPDAQHVMQIFMKIMRSDKMESDDVSVQYMMQSWARICTVLKDDFVECLPYVMPYVFKIAETKVDMTFLEEDDVDETTYKLNSNAMNNSIEDKSNGVSMLSSFLHDLKGKFVDFLEHTAVVMLKLMDCHVSDEIRGYAISSTPDLIKAGMEANREGRLGNAEVRDLFVNVTARINDCLKSEADIDLLMTLITALKLCVKEVGEMAPQMLPPEGLQAMAHGLMRLLENSHDRLVERQQHRQAEELDDEEVEDEEAFNQSEYELSFVASECIGTFTRVYREGFLPVFDMLSQDILQMLHPPSPVHVQTIAVFLFDDLIEFVGEPAGRYMQHFVPVMLQMASCESVELRQASSYGLGVCAEHSPLAFQPFLISAVGELVKAAMAPWAQLEENAACTDNVVSALARIYRVQLQSQQPQIDVQQHLPNWLGMLPLRDDHEEAENVYGFLCDLVAANNPYILGPNSQNLPHIVSLLVSIIDTEFANEVTTEKVVGILRQVKTMPPETLQQLIEAIDPQLHSHMNDVFSRIQ